MYRRERVIGLDEDVAEIGIDHGNHEQREERADEQTADDDPTDILAAPAPAPVASVSGTVPSTMAPVVIRMGRSRSVVLDHRIAHGLSLGAQLVGELDDQNAVLGDQADQGDEADLAIDVERAAPPQRAAARR